MGRQQRRGEFVAGDPVDFRRGQFQRHARIGDLEAELAAGAERAGEGPGAADAGEIRAGDPRVPNALLIEHVEVIVGEAALLLEMLLDDFGQRGLGGTGQFGRRLRLRFPALARQRRFRPIAGLRHRHRLTAAHRRRFSRAIPPGGERRQAARERRIVCRRGDSSAARANPWERCPARS